MLHQNKNNGWITGWKNFVTKYTSSRRKGIYFRSSRKRNVKRIYSNDRYRRNDWKFFILPLHSSKGYTIGMFNSGRLHAMNANFFIRSIKNEAYNPLSAGRESSTKWILGRESAGNRWNARDHGAEVEISLLDPTIESENRYPFAASLNSWIEIVGATSEGARRENSVKRSENKRIMVIVPPPPPL